MPGSELARVCASIMLLAATDVMRSTELVPHHSVLIGAHEPTKTVPLAARPAPNPVQITQGQLSLVRQVRSVRAMYDETQCSGPEHRLETV